LLPVVAVIWIIYTLVLVVIDHAFAVIEATRRPLPTPYYISQLLIPLFVLALTLSSWASAYLGRAFLPFIITTMSTLPLITTALTVPSSFPGPMTGVGGLVGIRTMPLLTVAVVLTALHYRLKHVLLVSMGASALVVLLNIRLRSELLNTAALTAAQGLVLLMVGGCVTSLMDKLRSQSASLEQTNDQLRLYASTLEQLAISRERNRVARELHDTLAHTLSGLTVQLEIVKAYWEVDRQAASTMVDSALETSRTGLRETRRALKALRASPLDELGLSLALCTLAEQAAEVAQLRLDCNVAKDIPALAPDIEQCIYRVTQESIANVMQHAQADTLLVHLSYHHDQFHLIVRDNGRGFDHQRTASNGHFGIAGMYERAAIVGGQLSITSVPGEGTTVSLHI
jgi:signal transduction histidine kinase